MSRRSTQCIRYATKIEDESSEIKRKISEMAKYNHRTVGLKGSTHSISYNVRTTTFTVLGSAVQANTTPMQKPDSGTGQTWLSSAVLTAHNILLPEGESVDALQSLNLLYSDRNVFLSTLKSSSCKHLPTR